MAPPPALRLSRRRGRECGGGGAGEAFQTSLIGSRINTPVIVVVARVMRSDEGIGLGLTGNLSRVELFSREDNVSPLFTISLVISGREGDLLN